MRTWLFVPGHEERKLRKALTSRSDVVIIDWEDGVPPDEKEEARSVTRAVLAEVSPALRLVVRVNPPQTPWHEGDMAVLESLPVAATMVPKAEDPVALQGLVRLGIPLIPLVESALGVERAFEIARAHRLVERLAFGSLDFLADIGARWTPEGEAIQYARARVVVAGRAAGLTGPIDGVYPRLDDPEGLRRDAEQARRLGYAGKLLVHPRQIDIVQEVFSPTPEEVAQARRIVAAYQDALAAGRAAVSVDGRLVDPPVVRWAEEVLRAQVGGPSPQSSR